ncbi:MAG: glycoside hydrolase family 13 protein [Chloroflexi bacterium]|nr:glycoside hydrolase family 13 protein [Chloroflexota bacterium]MCI0580753.1 glycoside hydrolase family 13 protein [Chloroflexota bacterium]MCI0644616.1 glycoside hydrolase family 13 protein [Chloroflexota bacterium]MCI0727621.1 glycoside hydrolase family 13 protein [Chloroflexota bacterium]
MDHVDTPDWVRDAVFYQIFPDRFARSGRVPQPDNLQPWGAPPTFHGYQGGDLPGIVEKLDYLVDLGVNALYLTPVFASAANHRYHTYDYYRIDPILGNNEDFDHFLRAAHQRSIRVILDGVFNHASRGFFQFNHLMENGPQSPYTGWFSVHGWPINAFNEHEPPNYDAWWNLHALPKFNTNHPAVREFLWDVATCWLKRGIDGWRLDVPGEIDDDEFWREFRRRCRAVNPEAYIVGELWDEAQRWLQGDQFDGQMNYLFTRAAIGFFCGEKADQSDMVHTGYRHIPPLSAEQFAAELDRLHNHLYHPDIVQAQLNMLGSHDTPRLMTVARNDASAVQLMFLCQMTIAGAPNIYYGDEIGLGGRRDPENRRAFPWQDEAGWNAGLLESVRQFVALRHQTPALRRGAFHVLHAAEGLVVYEREYASQHAIVALNAASSERTVALHRPAESVAGLHEMLIGENKRLRPGETITVPGRSGRVWVG